MDTAARTAESIGEPVTAWRTWVLKDGHLLSPRLGARWEHGTALRARARADQVWMAMVLLALPIAMFFVVVAGVPKVLSSIGDESHAMAAASLAMLVMIFIVVVTAIAVATRQALGCARALRGAPVQPGMGTPGIYAVNDPAKLDTTTDLLYVGLADVWRRLLGRVPAPVRGVVVRGQVHMWGDTILHTQGVKSEYAYPRSLTDVVCVRCFDWLPIDEWDDAGPPLHATCRPPATGRRHRIPGRYQYEPAGLEVARRGYGLTTEEGPA